MQEHLSDEKIKSITSNAIQKYPLAWTVLKRAAVINDIENIFEKVNEADMRDVGEIFTENEYKKVVCDGYSLEFDDYLKEELGNVIAGRIDIFYVDCFKGLSRNFEKILHVLQIILQSEKAFVTCNYYISNGRMQVFIMI